MMTLGMPWVFTGAIAGALAITALHLLSVRRPPELWLPTARFLPERTVRAISRTRHPSDVWLLLLRIVALLLAGLAAATPRWQGGSGARVVLVVRDAGVTDDSLAMRALVTSADTGAPRAARFIFAAADSSDGARDELGVLFPVAWRAAGRIARDAPTDSIDLHLLLSQAPIAHDADAAAWRAAWPGRVVTHHPAFPPPSRPTVVALDRVGANAGDDVVRAAFAWHAARRSSVRSGATRSHTVGVARATRTGEPTPSRETPSVRVFWPSDGVPVGWRRATTADSTGAVVANEQAVVGAWAVTAIPDTTDTAMAIAWWSDGRVAATERRTESGCDRVVAIRSTAASDALLSASANGLFDRLLAPCAPREMVSASTLVVQGVQGSALAPVTEFSGDARAAPRPVRGVTAWLIPSLYAAALLLLLLEWRVRRRPPTATT